MTSSAPKQNQYIKPLAENFLAESYHHSCAMSYTHVHSVYELYFCPEALHHECNICGNEYRYHQATVILLKPYTIHSIYVSDPWPKGKTWYVFSFSESTAAGTGMDQILTEMIGDRMSLLYTLSQQQAEYLATILQFLFNPAYPLAESDALSIFSFFLRRLKSLTTDEQIIGVGSTDYSVQQVMQYICENLSSSLTAETLSRQFSVSRSKLDRDFKASIGVTPKYFTELCRLHFAKKLLLSQKETRISDIAQQCGFPSENYFYRFFRSQTGQTPTQYKHRVVRNTHI